MLITSKRLENLLKVVITLQLIISIFIIQKPVFAANKKEVAAQYREQGVAEQKNGNFIEALNYYTKAISLGYQDAVVYNDMGILNEQLGNLYQAEQFYLKSIITDAGYLPAYTNLAYVYLNLGKKERAAAYFKQRFVKAEPGDPWGIKAKEELLKLKPGYIQWFKRMDEQRVQEEVKRLENEVSHNFQVEFERQISKANNFYQSGKTLALDGKLEQAITEFDRALAITPKSTKIIEARAKVSDSIKKRDFYRYSNRATQMFDSGDTQSARKEIQRMLTTLSSDSMNVSQ